MKYHRHAAEHPMVQHNGIFRRRISFWQAVTLMSSLGAGILGIPYVIAQVGLKVGIAYIIFVGLLMMGMNMLLGDIAVRTGHSLQLVGLARRYLGKKGEILMSVIVYSTLFGVLNVYIIGCGEALSAVFGGTSFWWSMVFFCVASFFVFIGLRTIKTVEFILLMISLGVMLLIAWLSISHVNTSYWVGTHLENFLLPYGVLLFAFHGTTSVPEAYSLLRNRERNFHQAIATAGLIGITIYCIFAIVVVQVTGPATTPLATVGLGQALGPTVLILGNLFAVFTMSMGFLMAGVSLSDSLSWDLHLSRKVTTALVCGVPLALFLFGVRSFIATIDIIGGVFATIEMMLILLMYWLSRRTGLAAHRRFGFQHTLPVALVLLLALSVGAVYSVLKLF